MKKGNVNFTYEFVAVCFIPFIVVIFIDFVVKLGLEPFIEKISIFLPVYASIIAVCSYVWIRKGIIFSFIPIISFTVLIPVIFRSKIHIHYSFLFYFLSLFVLSFVSVLNYAIMKTISTHRSTYSFYMLQFLTGLVIFTSGALLVNVCYGFFNSGLSILQSLLFGLKDGISLGTGIITVILVLAQKDIKQ